jgi:uncharacterized protein YgbK (DUF1537 family)
MTRRCLIVADDLTGGADTGVQFSRKGPRTFFLTSENLTGLDLPKYSHCDVLVVNTGSRGMRPGKAFSAVASVMKTYDKTLFPIIYKKIDSTLRGNIGYEIDAILEKTQIPMAFVAPSLPGQNRTLVGGIMMVAGRPVALTEMARDAVSPVRESHICKLIQRQSRHLVACIDLTHVSSGCMQLKKAVLKEKRKGARIIIFDATSNDDLANIAEVAFCLDTTPLLVGSAGLAEEVAKQVCSSFKEGFLPSSLPGKEGFSHFFIISGSASSVTHRQLEKLETSPGITSFELDPSILPGDEHKRKEYERDLCGRIVKALRQGHAILKVFSGRISSNGYSRPPIHARITRLLGSIALAVLQQFAGTLDMDRLAVVLTGGETAVSVLNSLGVEGVEIDSELLGGIAMSRVHDGNMAGLAVITKAGAFGKEDALQKIMEIAATKCHQTNASEEMSGVEASAPSIPVKRG